ncbi:TBC1 domain family member 9 [Phyllostomus discolor]|nr:TBC1 domain family member 9 [Phyllostomus discolor]
MFALLFPWACGTHSDVLASRLFQLLDENGDSLINFREFVSGLNAACHGDLTEKLKLLYKMHVLPEPSSDQDEPDSAFEATQYFFEDITPECTHVVGLDGRSKHSADDGFVTVSLKPDRGKRANSQENRIYLRLWTAENKSKSKNARDLPKLNQGQFIELCKTMYNMFSEDPNEQELYHATAAVTSLLLEIGEVGKLFVTQPGKEVGSGPCSQGIPGVPFPKKGPGGGGGAPFGVEPVEPHAASLAGDAEDHSLGGQMEDIKLEDSSPRDNGACSSMLISDDDTKDDSSMSSYSVLSAGSHEEDKLHCEDIGEDTVLVRSGQGTAALPGSASLDRDWAITFEQFLASLLTEPALVRYFDKPVCMMARITSAKNVRMMGRALASASDYEISALSG